MTYIGNTSPSRFSSVPAVQRFSGNNSTTSFTLSTAIGSEQEILVSVDGVIQDTANYTVSGTTLTFSPAPSAGTNNIFVFTLSRAIASVTHPPTSALSATSGTFSGNITGTTATLTTDDNLPQLTVVSTDADANLGPIIRLYRNSASPADGDSTGKIEFQAKTDTGSQLTYASLNTITSDVSNGSPDATFYIQTLTNNSHSNRFFISPTEIVLNEDSLDADFRVESDNDANAFFVQGSDGFVGLGTSSPSQLLHLKSTTNAKPNLLIETENAGANGGRLDFLHKSSSPADGDLLGDITFGGYSDDGTPPSDFARYVMIKAYAEDVSNNNEKGRLTFSIHNGASNENNVDVLTLNGDKVGIGTSSPAFTLEVNKGSAGDIARFTDGVNANTVIKTSGSVTTFGPDTANSLAFQTNNTERMRLDASGNVGIGTASPSYLLDVLKSGSGDAAMQIKTTTGGDPTLIFNSAQANRSGIIKYQDNGTNIGRIQYNHSGDRIDIQAGSSTGATMSILNGKVGIGTTTPGSFGSITSDLVVGTTSGEHGMTIASGTGNSGRLQFADNTASPFRGAIEYAHGSTDALLFYTAGSQRMRIASDGKVGINESSPDAMLHIVNGYPNTAIKTESNTANGHWAIEFHNSNGRVGNIMTIGSATQFNTSSDYRLKENVKYDFDATSRLKQLKPARFNFIADADTTVDGFIAHEVSSIVPEAISGEKDAVDGDGKAVMQGIDQSKLVPLLTKALQEQQATIEALTARIVSLESKE